MRNHLRVARESVWVQIGGVLLFVAAVAAVSNFARPQLSGTALVAAGIVLAVVPAALWLWMFYREDRFEPEPRQYVVGVFFLGALLAYAIGQPVIRELYRVQDWLGTNLVTAVLGSILVGGLVTQFILYAVVRYTVFNSAEFDQRIDGIVYGAAAGLGYATMTNIQYVVGNNGVDLGIGAMRVAVEALSLASLGAVSGYFLARAKFDKMGPTWLPLGLIIAAVLNGVIDLTLSRIPMLGSGFGFNPWYGVAAAVVIAGAIFAVLFQLIQRLNVAGAATSQKGSALDAVLVGEGKSEEPEWIVWLVVAVGLIAAWVLGSAVMGQTRTATSGKMTLTYPASWAQTTEQGAAFAAYDFERGGIFGTRVSMRQKPIGDYLPAQGTLDDAAANWALERQDQLLSFHLLNIIPTQIQGRAGAKLEYAYLLDPPQGSSMPALMRAVDTLVVSGDQLLALSFAAESHQFASLDGLYDQLLAGWRVQ
ncbi:MAG: PrsW family intramembrane metalloprotease [Chloroflexi bacterium]|nr:PrsW family intramembrane metalloprotease [Chloroflexota bacterium]